MRKGSTWRRWDLHVHTPASALNNQFEGSSDEERWERYLAALSGIGDYAGLAITDYFSIDGYKRVAEAHAAGKLPNIAFVLPNIELRILPVTDKSKAINIHLLVCPSITHELERTLFSRLSFRYDGEKYDCTRDSLVQLGRHFRKNSALEEEAAFRAGVEQFKTDADQIRECLKESRRLKEHSIIVVANSKNDGNSGIPHSSLASTREEIYRLSHAIFSSNPADREYFLGRGKDSVEVLTQRCGGLKACIHGSDAHELAKLGKPDLNRYTWILAEPTFEGLRQVCYEPEHRLSIGEFPPPTSLHRIQSVEIDFPEEAMLLSGKEKTAFCLRGKHQIAMANGLTCIIGGRGSGKSTLLNLLHESSQPGENRFFASNKLRRDEFPLTARDHVRVNTVSDAATIEFLSQNEIEEFAQNPKRFTSAIYSRLQRIDDDGELKAAHDAVAVSVREIEAAIKDDEAQYESEALIARLEQQQVGLQNVMRSVEDPEYLRLVKELRESAEALNALTASREALSQLCSSLETLVRGARSDALDANDVFATRLRVLVDSVSAAIVRARDGLQLSTTSQEESELDGERRAKELAMRQFLSARNLSPENITDIAQASERLVEVSASLEGARARLALQREKRASRKIDVGCAQRLNEAIQRRLEDINKRLVDGGKEVKSIALRYWYDSEGARTQLVEQLLKRLGEATGVHGLRVDHLTNVLERAKAFERDVGPELLSALNADTAKVAGLCVDYLANDLRTDIWQLLMLRAQIDAVSAMRFDAFYDGRALSLSSFGQRCSAVIIVLLSLGNNPIVIDEPEAHLDSSLIANFLVRLVKLAKTQRQIIFATHNANFVVNGDAELIHILSSEGNGATSIQSTTIEDLKDRPKLLALEGGKRAFRQRESRYRLN